MGGNKSLVLIILKLQIKIIFDKQPELTLKGVAPNKYTFSHCYVQINSE